MNINNSIAKRKQKRRRRTLSTWLDLIPRQSQTTSNSHLDLLQNHYQGRNRITNQHLRSLNHSNNPDSDMEGVYTKMHMINPPVQADVSIHAHGLQNVLEHPVLDEDLTAHLQHEMTSDDDGWTPEDENRAVLELMWLREETEHGQASSRAETYVSGALESSRGQDVSDQKDQELLEKINRDTRFLLHPDKLLALLCIRGSVRFTVKHFELVRTITKWAGDVVHMPSYKTVRRAIFKHVLQECFPSSEVVMMSTDPEEKIPEKRTRRGDEQEHPHETNTRKLVRIIPPSEWAKLDVLTLPFFQNMLSGSLVGAGIAQACTVPLEPNIENTVMVKDRRTVTNPDEFIFAAVGEDKYTCSRGAVVTAKTNDIPSSLTSNAIRKLGYCIKSGHAETESHPSYTISGTIGAVWCVGAINQITGSCATALGLLQGHEREIMSELLNERLQQHSTRVRQKGDRRRFFTQQSSTARNVKAGDICALLSLQGDGGRIPTRAIIEN